MSERECECLQIDDLPTCNQGKILIHLADHEVAMNELQEKLDQAQTELQQYKARETADQRAENETLNHLRVEQSHHQIQLTLRGKSKMFTPGAIKDLISKLQIMAENAESHEPAAMIHCSHGLNADMMDFRGPIRLEK